VSATDVTIFVCVACRRGDDADTRPGALFLEALRERLAAEGETGLRVEPVECLAVCKRPATVALSAGGKWSYVVGDLDADEHIEEILASARGFAASENGIVPWKDRPQCFKKGVVSRVPPPGFVAPKA
jgi:predicted metal-binding protein